MIRKVLSEICELLNRHEVEYLVIGGYAVVFHGYTRTTADLDFWYNPTLSNFHRIINAFKEHGVDVSGLDQVVFDSKNTFLRLPIAGLNAEFLPDIPGGIAFRDAMMKSEVLELDGVVIKIIGYDHLLRNKAATNRLKDKADIEELKKRKS